MHSSYPIHCFQQVHSSYSLAQYDVEIVVSLSHDHVTFAADLEWMLVVPTAAENSLLSRVQYQ